MRDIEPGILRALDANLNRAREALRVLDDVARFVLDDASLCEDLKTLRHQLVNATRGWELAALPHRNSPGDVGTTLTTPAERTRGDAAAVAIAAGKRLGEALRSIEEFGKIVDPDVAAVVESIRYRSYELERRLRAKLDSSGRFERVRLYVLITESACRLPWQQVARAAVVGGADALQLREKNLDGGELLARARWLVELCRSNRVLCIVNDRADVAIAAGADGVHLGQTDLPIDEIRWLVGPRMIVGVSTHMLEQAQQAERDGADYIGVGPIFRSPTKPRDIDPGLPFARQVNGEIRIPTIAIAGITLGNIQQLLDTGMSRVAVTSAITQSEDPQGATSQFRGMLID